MAGTKTYIRIAGKRDITDDLVSVGGNDYEATFPELVYNAEQISTSSETITNTRSFSQSGTTLTVTTTTTPSATQPIVISFYIFVTDKIVSYEKTNITTGDVVEWEPWLTKTPKITQSIGDILEGKLIVSASSIKLLNEKSLNYLMDEKTSFFNQPIKIWADYGNGSIEDVFTGRTTNFTVGTTNFDVRFKNDFVALTGQPTMGDLNYENYYTFDSTHPLYSTPRRYQWGLTSPLQFAQYTNVISQVGAIYKKEGAVRAYYTGSDPGVGDYHNFQTLKVESGYSYAPDASFTLISGGTAGLSSAVIEFDDDIEFQKVIVGLYQGQFYDNAWRNCHVAISDLANRRATIYISSAVVTTFQATVTNFKANSPCFLFTDSNDFDYNFGYWTYTSLFGLTSEGGHTFVGVKTSSRTPEQNNSGAVVLDPQKHDVYAILPTNLQTKHGDVIKAIAEGNGLTVNSASITAANAALAENVFMVMPDVSKDEYKSALDTIGDVLVSTFGYVYINKSGELVYKLVDTDTASHAITDTDIIDGSLNVSMDFRDIFTKINAFPLQKCAMAIDSTGESAYNSKEMFMSDTDKTYDYKTVLYDNSAVLQTKLNYLSRPRLKISMTIPNTFSSMEIGEFVDLSSVQLEDMDLSNLMITTITRTSVFLEITLTKIEIT